MKERWKTVKTAPRYEVSTHGRIRGRATLKHKFRHGGFGCMLRPAVGKNGYPRVSLSVARKTYRSFYVHTLVAAAFIGKRPKGHHIDHIDAVRTNNKLTNLRYLLAALNTLSMAVLSPAQASVVKYALIGGCDAWKVAAAFGLSEGIVSHINHGRTWATIKPLPPNGYPYQRRGEAQRKRWTGPQ